MVVGSRARHTAAEELAVPVDVFPAEQLAQQGSTETSVILQAVSPSINFPRQSVTDAGDVVRPFTLRGLSPDHTLVLLNGWRRHQTALVNNFTYGMGAGSSGVDLNAIPSSALDRIEVLRDGAAAQYGSDAIAGVVNLVLKDGAFTPFVNGDAGRYTTDDYPDDGTTVNVNGGWGIPLGRGSLGLFGEFRDRQPTNRAWADAFEVAGTGVADSINDIGQVVHKNNPVPQPNHHWGDGLEKDALTFANFRMPVNASGTSEIYAFGGYSHRDGDGNPFRRYAGSAPELGRHLPAGLPAGDPGTGDRLLRWPAGSAASCRAGTTTSAAPVRPQQFRLQHQQHAERLARALPRRSLRAGCSTACSAPRRPGHPEPARLLRRAGAARGVDHRRSTSPSRWSWGCRSRSTWRSARRSGASGTPSARASWPRTSTAASTDQTGAGTRRPSGSQSFPGFTPSDATDRHRNNFGLYADAESQPVGQGAGRRGGAVRGLQRLRLAGERQGGAAVPAVAAGHAPRGGEHRVPRAGPEPGVVQQGA